MLRYAIELHPMSFLEFLEAVGEKRLAALVQSSQYRNFDELSSKYIFWLKNYYYVGGMPEVVAYFAEHKNYAEVRHIQNEILNQYEDDFGKHASGTNLARIRMVWNSIPMQLAKENKKFFFGKIKKGARMKDFEMAIEWLADCGLITRVYKVNKPAIPLKAYMDFAAFKLFTLDVGLLGAMSDIDAKTILEGNSMFIEFKGALTEQYVLQELVAETEYKPYYFGTDSNNFEMDFMIQRNGMAVPIEVKAEGNTQAKSLKLYAERYKPEQMIRASMLGYVEQGPLVNYPLYAIADI